MSNKGETQRQKKISSLLQKEIAKLIQNQLRNNGIKNLIISVTKVKVSVDLSIARIYLSIFPSSNSEDQIELIQCFSHRC